MSSVPESGAAASTKVSAVVIDSSLAMKWLLQEEHSDKAALQLKAWAAAETALLAPDLIAAEIASALYKRMRKGDLDPDAGQHMLTAFLQLEIELVPTSPLSRGAVDLAAQLKLSAPYDAHYLALALREQCELWTADERLVNGVRSRYSWVRWIGEV